MTAVGGEASRCRRGLVGVVGRGGRSVLPKVWSAGVSVAKTPIGVGEGHHSVSLEVVQCRRRSSSVANEKTAGRCRLCHQRPHSAVKVRCSFDKWAGCLRGASPVLSAPKASTVQPS